MSAVPFPVFLQQFEATLKDLFHNQFDIDQISTERGLPPELLRRLMDTNPLSVAIPEASGGKGCSTKQILALLEKAAYESLPLSLVLGINIGLFLYPVAKYAPSETKEPIFERFLEHRNMGGLMITEPGHGSDALSMRTSYTQSADGYSIQGTKHWQGLTGMADYWLIAARKQMGKETLGRDIDLFISDNTVATQKVEVLEYYDNAGLYMIPYGRNKIEVQLPAQSRLEPQTTGIKMLLDILHRSRMQFPGMGMGFIKRMLDDALMHCRNRMVGIRNLLSMDHIQYQLSRIQSAYTLCSAMCARSSKISSLDEDLSGSGLEANTIKALVTDLMQEAAQIMLQVSGAGGYRLSHIAGRGIMDSRPFQIFEGSNEMLYTQVADMVTRQMKQQKQGNLFSFLKECKLTAAACWFFKVEFSFKLNTALPQRKMLELGRILSRVISLNYVLDLSAKGFRADLVNNCVAMVKQEIAGMFRSFCADNNSTVIEAYEDNSAWVNFV